MTAAPRVSVVMAVRNGEAVLPATLESVLAQTECDLEFIVINDGSTDGSGALLDQWAVTDQRLRVFHQENAGLTQALIRGCAAARGEFIARQDAGDLSLPGRLQRQVGILCADPACVAASCHSEFIGPKDEPLYKVGVDEVMLNESLRGSSGSAIFGPSHHGTVMMRRTAYLAAGGYRKAFYFAQDLDLWTRLAELGHFSVVQEILYRARLEVNSISGTQSREQRMLAKIVAQATSARRSGESESALLAEASSIRPIPVSDRNRRLAKGNYFIGSCLRKRLPASAATYFLHAARLDPSHWRAWLRCAECMLRSALGPAPEGRRNWN